MSAGGGGYYGGEKSNERRRESYNSMANTVARGDIKEKEPPMLSPESDTTKVGGMSGIGAAMSRATRGNSDDGGYNRSATAEKGIAQSKSAGEAITVNYARSVKKKDRKPVIKLSDPPPAKPKKTATATAPAADLNTVSDDDDDDKTPGDSGKWNLFPKVDPSPKRASRPLLTNPFAKQAPKAAATTAASAQPQQPPAAATSATNRTNSNSQGPVSLQKWLQTAAVSPFGPLTTDPPQPQRTGRGLPGSVRLSEVKWPLQDDGLPTRSDSNGGGVGGERMAEQVVIVKSNEAAKVVPRPSMVGVGLPGPARKLPLRDR